jgi:hypothetical protein
MGGLWEVTSSRRIQRKRRRFFFFCGGPDTRMVKKMGLLGISTGNRDFMEEMVV